MNDGILRRYWRAYGGIKALVTSIYLYVALVLTIVTYPTWSTIGWWQHVLSVMPSVLGFSLGGYAIWMAIGDEHFRAMMSGEGENGGTSPFMAVNAAFVHFILMQILAILIALVASAYNFPFNTNGCFAHLLDRLGLSVHSVKLVASGVGYLVFLYALMTAVAATLAILRVSSWYDQIQTRRLRENRQNGATEKQD